MIIACDKSIGHFILRLIAFIEKRKTMLISIILCQFTNIEKKEILDWMKK